MQELGNSLNASKAQIPLGSSPLDSTRLDKFDVSSRAHAFWLCRACRTARLDTLDTTSSTGSTRSTRRARLTQLAQHDELDRRDSQLSLLCNFYKVMITVLYVLFNVSYSLIYWFHVYLIYFIWRNK